MFNFILLALSSFIVASTTARFLTATLGRTRFQSNALVISFLIGWYGLFVALFRLFNV